MVNILDKSILTTLQDRLLQGRRKILESRLEKADAWQYLNTRESELMDSATQENLSRLLGQLDHLEVEELRRIEEALGKMDEGSFGLCNTCNKPITVKRLYALPTAQHCVRCARLRKDVESDEPAGPAVGLDKPPLSDEEIRRAVVEAVDREDKIDTQELNIRCAGGVVYLDGLLPSETQRQRLLELVEVELGFKHTADNLAIDRQPWERVERSAAPKPIKEEKDVQMEGEDEDVDAMTSLKTGEPMTPPDRMTPEKP